MGSTRSNNSESGGGGGESRAGRRWPALVLAVTVVFALLATAAYAAVRPSRGDDPTQPPCSGRAWVANSASGDALAGMEGMLPGDCVAGTLEIGNSSDVRARFTLGLSRLVEAPGRGGGRLSSRLVLTVEWLKAAGPPQRVYSGPLRHLSDLELGVFAPGEIRTYRVTVVFPDGDSSEDDCCQGASVSVEFTWSARRAQ